MEEYSRQTECAKALRWGKFESNFQGCLNDREFELASTRRNGLCSDKAQDGRAGPPALECSDLLAGGGFLGGATLWLGFCSQHSGNGGQGSM